ncbi:selenoo1 [Symbiodinium natans]|uniref:Selenoprotein O n=1 Tax=Symbiodinium natans TaxID=878477 RepID=A0A812PIN5_9DINO|nr:selenoo1 [Symbiodinium natans]
MRYADQSRDTFAKVHCLPPRSLWAPVRWSVQLPTLRGLRRWSRGHWALHVPSRTGGRMWRGGRGAGRPRSRRGRGQGCGPGVRQPNPQYLARGCGDESNVSTGVQRIGISGEATAFPGSSTPGPGQCSRGTALGARCQRQGRTDCTVFRCGAAAPCAALLSRLRRTPVWLLVWAAGRRPSHVSRGGSWLRSFAGAGRGRCSLVAMGTDPQRPIFLEAAGVPVASTVAVLGSDFEEDRIIRDEWYSGEAAFKKPGITVRSMPSFLRFGSLQLAAKRQGLSGVETIARYVLAAVARMEAHDDAATAYLDQLPVTVPPELRARCFYGKLPEASCAAQAQSLPRAELLRCLLRRVTERTAALLAAWMAVGFAHGVMNTDNLSLLGITVDLNVFGFLSTYDPTWQPNYIDETARYAFGEQPDIARWNLQRLADALTGTSFVSDREPDAQLWPHRQPGEWMDRQEAAHILDRFNETFEVCRVARMELRLGFPATGRPCTADSPGPACLESRWRQWLTRARADYPRASRGLAEIGAGDAAAAAAKLASHAGAEGKDLDTLTALLREFRALHGEKDFAAAVRAAVPSVSPRSHILREAARVVEMEKPGDTAAAFLSEVQRLLASPHDTRALGLDELEDDPREAWRNVNLAGPPPPDMRSCANEGITLLNSIMRRLRIAVNVL